MRKKNHSKRILIVGIDAFLRKNRLQIESLTHHGWRFTVVTHDRTERSSAFFVNLEHSHELIQLPKSSIHRIGILLRLMLKHWHHVELYATSRSALAYAPLLKLFRHCIFVVERGDIDCLPQLPSPQRYAIKVAYRLASIVLYKEPYMLSLMSEPAARKAIYWPNAALEQNRSSETQTIDFLWANRVLQGRHADILVSALDAEIFANARTVILGISKAHLNTVEEKLLKMSQSHLGGQMKALTWGEPFQFMEQSRYFVLFADRVFGNNALLEAMHFGVVPIVNHSNGIETLISHGENGFIVDLSNFQAVRDVLLSCLTLSDERWQFLSEAATKKVRTEFSSQKWSDRTNEIYCRLSV